MKNLISGVLFLVIGAILGAGGLYYYMQNHHDMMAHTPAPVVDVDVAEVEAEIVCPTVEAAAIAPEVVAPLVDEPVTKFAADFAPDFDGVRVRFNSPFIFETSPNAKTAAAFGFIQNVSPQPDRLIGASYEFAERVEIHTMEDDGEIMRMRKVEAIEIDAGKKVVLEPQGLHIMLIGLQKQLKDGDKVAMTLSFEESGDVEVEFPVIFRGVADLEGEPPVDHSGHDHGEHSHEDQ